MEWLDAGKLHVQPQRGLAPREGCLLPTLYYGMGILYGNMDRFREAIEAYKQAIRLKPDYGDVHFNLALSLLRMGEKDSVLNEYQILKNLNYSGADELFKLVSQ